MFLRRVNSRHCYSRTTGRYDRYDLCHISPRPSEHGSLEDLERKFLMKYETCSLRSRPPSPRAGGIDGDVVGTRCPVGDTDPTQRYRISSARSSPRRECLDNSRSRCGSPDRSRLDNCSNNSRSGCPASDRSHLTGSPRSRTPNRHMNNNAPCSTANPDIYFLNGKPRSRCASPVRNCPNDNDDTRRSISPDRTNQLGKQAIPCALWKFGPKRPEDPLEESCADPACPAEQTTRQLLDCSQPQCPSAPQSSSFPRSPRTSWFTKSKSPPSPSQSPAQELTPTTPQGPSPKEMTSSSLRPSSAQEPSSSKTPSPRQNDKKSPRVDSTKNSPYALEQKQKRKSSRTSFSNDLPRLRADSTKSNRNSPSSSQAQSPRIQDDSQENKDSKNSKRHPSSQGSESKENAGPKKSFSPRNSAQESPQTSPEVVTPRQGRASKKISTAGKSSPDSSPGRKTEKSSKFKLKIKKSQKSRSPSPSEVIPNEDNKSRAETHKNETKSSKHKKKKSKKSRSESPSPENSTQEHNGPQTETVANEPSEPTVETGTKGPGDDEMYPKRPFTTPNRSQSIDRRNCDSISCPKRSSFRCQLATKKLCESTNCTKPCASSQKSEKHCDDDSCVKKSSARSQSVTKKTCNVNTCPNSPKGSRMECPVMSKIPVKCTPNTCPSKGQAQAQPQPCVAATLKDLVSRIASYGLQPFAQDENSTRQQKLSERDDRRSVRFCDACADGGAEEACAECCAGVEELFFNDGLTKSEASMDDDAKTDRTNTNVPKESGVGSSLVSGSSNCDGARAQYYHNKLMATLQILQNKEETCRVQAESLAVAESRIATLSCRTVQLKKDLDDKNNEISDLRSALASYEAKASGTDISAQTEEVAKQKNMIKTLQTNLSVIEELYRECFYETVKQEALIETLRKSYLDVRLMEKDKADRITKLNNVITSQKWSLDRCQNIAAEVENLKLEISHFLNNSNNDSGMWEREDSPTGAGDNACTGAGAATGADDVTDELRAIQEQLLVLKGVLSEECDCDLKEENERLRETVGNLETQVNDYQRRLCSLECAVEDRDSAIQQWKEESNRLQDIVADLEAQVGDYRERLCVLQDQQKGDVNKYKMENERLRETIGDLENQVGDYRQQICGLECALNNKEDELEQYKRINEQKDEECECAQQKIRELMEREKEAQRMYKQVAQELQRTQAFLEERSSELCYAQRRCEEHENTIEDLQRQLDKANKIAKENSAVRSEVKQLTSQVSQWRAQLLDSEARVRAGETELQQAREYAQRLEDCYRSQTASAAALQSQLEAAHARGAALCAEARRVVCGVRTWVRRMKARHREQEETVRQQACRIECLEKALREARNKPCSPGSPRRLVEEKAKPCRPCSSGSPRKPIEKTCPVADDPWCTSMPGILLSQAKRLLTEQFGASDQPTCDVCPSDQPSYEVCPSRSVDSMLQQPSTSRMDSSSAEGGNQSCCCKARAAGPLPPSPPAPPLPPSPPPRRLLRKKISDECCARKRRTAGAGEARARSCVRPPQRDQCDTCQDDTGDGSASPTDTLRERVERLHQVLSEEQRAWANFKSSKTTKK